MTIRTSMRLAIVVGLAVALFSGQAYGTTEDCLDFPGTGSGGIWTFGTPGEADRAAKATFTQNGDTITIALENLADDYARSQMEPVHVLTGVLFDIGAADFDPIGAEIAGNSAYLILKKNVTPPAGAVGPSSDNRYLVPLSVTDVGGEWAYRSDMQDIAGELNPPAHVISSVGFDNLVGADSEMFGPTNLWGPDAVAGINAGITGGYPDLPPGSDDIDIPNGGLLSGATMAEHRGLIDHSVEFTLKAPTTADIINSIQNVYFHYGTDTYNPPSPPPVIPEPLTMFALVAGLGGISRYVRKRRLMA